MGFWSRYLSCSLTWRSLNGQLTAREYPREYLYKEIPAHHHGTTSTSYCTKDGKGQMVLLAYHHSFKPPLNLYFVQLSPQSSDWHSVFANPAATIFSFFQAFLLRNSWNRWKGVSFRAAAPRPVQRRALHFQWQQETFNSFHVSSR